MAPSALGQSWLPSSSSYSTSFASTLSSISTSSCAASGSSLTTPEHSPDRSSTDDEDEYDRENWLAESSPESDATDHASLEDSDDDLSPKFGSTSRLPASTQSRNLSAASSSASSSSSLSSGPTAKSAFTSSSASSSGSMHPYRPQIRRPVRGLSPLTPTTTTTTTSRLLPAPPAVPAGRSLPKSQPLARALFARIAQDAPHAGSGLGATTKKKNGPQKIIVPTKPFRTTFELDLTASELARKA